MVLAKEIFASCFNDETFSTHEKIYLRCSIDQPLHVDIDQKNYHRLIVVLFKNEYDFQPTANQAARVVDEHVAFARREMAHGAKHFALATHGDGWWQKFLSPRFNSCSINERIKPLIDLYQQLKAIDHNVKVFLTVEELAPGGLDATDGVAIAKALYDAGLREIIATCGSKDFPALFFRRATLKKTSEHNFYSNEPTLASALWLTRETKLKVYCAGFFEDEARAEELATSLGIAGIIVRAAP